MAENRVGLQKVVLAEISPYIYNALIVGVIVGKQRPKVFERTGKDNKKRGVWSFTIRDSIRDYINVTCWNFAENIVIVGNRFHIGDVVELVKPRIEIRRSNDYGKQFRPMVTSPYALVIDDVHGQIIHHEGDCEKYKKLLSFPTKPLAKFVTIANIINSDIKNELVDILVSVRSVAEVRSVTVRDESMEVREIVVFDHTNPGLKISLWDPEYIQRADHWKPRETILFMTDMKIDYNKYFKCKTAVTTSCTIITENPCGMETETLRNYAISAPLEPVAILDMFACSFPNPETIQNVMTVAQVYAKIDSKQLLQSDDQQFTGLLYAVITKFDLDGPSRVILKKCCKCKTLMGEQDERCTKPECPIGMGVESGQPDLCFDLLLSISDHTGTLTGCRLNGKTAENVLGYNVYEFLQLSETQVFDLKWKYLLERCSIRIAVLCIPSRSPMISILSLTHASISEVGNRLPHL